MGRLKKWFDIIESQLNVLPFKLYSSEMILSYTHNFIRAALLIMGNPSAFYQRLSRLCFRFASYSTNLSILNHVCIKEMNIYSKLFISCLFKLLSALVDTDTHTRDRCKRLKSTRLAWHGTHLHFSFVSEPKIVVISITKFFETRHRKQK